MTNFEKYADQLKEFFSQHIGISKYDGKFKNCDLLDCKGCILYSDDYGNYRCVETKRQWLKEEYVEPPVDWTKVVVDTPILVRDNPKNVWEKRYFAGFKRGKVYAFTGGRTSWTMPNNGSAMSWKYAKLAEQE